MKAMLEVIYPRPRDLAREQKISEVVGLHGGRFDFFEETDIPAVSQTITLTFVFDTRARAEAAESALTSLGHHVEGPCDYPAEKEEEPNQPLQPTAPSGRG